MTILGRVPYFAHLPGSNVGVELKGSGKYAMALIHCDECSHRLYDVAPSYITRVDDYTGEPYNVAAYKITRVCRACKRMNETYVTTERGYPLGDEVEAWTCECGAYLGGIDAPRGRITVKCPKCRDRKKITVCAAYAYRFIVAVEERNRRKRESPTPEASKMDAAS